MFKFLLVYSSKVRHQTSILFAEGRAVKDWFASFMRRHTEISVRKAEGISLSIAQGMNKEETPKYFDLLKKTLMENDLMKEPGHIFNSDDIGLQLNNNPGHVIAKIRFTDVHLLTSAEKGGTISVMACCSAEGHFLSPVCTFKGVNTKQEFEGGLPPGSAVIMSKMSAYVASEVFIDMAERSPRFQET
jgi:hypothetical protein